MVLSSERLIETITVPNIGCDSPLLCYIYAKIWRRFRRKLLFINVFNLNRMILKLVFSIYNQFLIFLYKKVIETITVHENGCNNVLFWCIDMASLGFIGPPKILGPPLIPKLQVPLNLSGRTFSYFGPPYQYFWKTP